MSFPPDIRLRQSPASYVKIKAIDTTINDDITNPIFFTSRRSMRSLSGKGAKFLLRNIIWDTPRREPCIQNKGIRVYKRLGDDISGFV